MHKNNVGDTCRPQNEGWWQSVYTSVFQTLLSTGSIWPQKLQNKNKKDKGN